MGFLSKLFKRPLTRDRWYVRAELLSELSEIARRHWVAEWKAVARGEKLGGAPRTASVKELRKLPEHAAVALRVQQAHLSIDFIHEHKYLEPEDQDEFARYLLGYIVGEETPLAVALLAHYRDIGADPQLLQERFAADLAPAFGTDDPDVTQRIAATVPQFILEQQYITALTFGRDPTLRDLRSQIEAGE